PQPPAEQYSSRDGWKPLFNGNNLAGWKYRNPDAKKVWVVCDDVRMDPSNPGKLLPVGSGGSPATALLYGDDGRGSDIMTDEALADYQLHMNLSVPAFTRPTSLCLPI
ncbi:MAG: family 16 glycoside hydrolase, partial [Isosphaeraceae bacterium]